MDIRLNDESFSNEETLEALKSVCPPDIEFFAVCDPVKPTKEIGFSEYKLEFDEIDSKMSTALNEFFARESVICEKVGKKGKVKEVDIIPKIHTHSIDGNVITLTLVAGSEDNLNPTLVMDTFFDNTGIIPTFYTVLRTAILDKSGNEFE